MSLSGLVSEYPGPEFATTTPTTLTAKESMVIAKLISCAKNTEIIFECKFYLF